MRKVTDLSGLMSGDFSVEFGVGGGCCGWAYAAAPSKRVNRPSWRMTVSCYLSGIRHGLSLPGALDLLQCFPLRLRRDERNEKHGKHANRAVDPERTRGRQRPRKR